MRHVGCGAAQRVTNTKKRKHFYLAELADLGGLAGLSAVCCSRHFSIFGDFGQMSSTLIKYSLKEHSSVCFMLLQGRFQPVCRRSMAQLPSWKSVRMQFVSLCKTNADRITPANRSVMSKQLLVSTVGLQPNGIIDKPDGTDN